MEKYVCSICGFIYDEESGYPEGGISPGTLWSDITSSFVCPLCGASKAEFNKKEEKSVISATPISLPDDINYSTVELSAIFSNLAKGCEKQYEPEMSELYQQLSDYYKMKSKPDNNPDFENLQGLLQEDLNSNFAFANEIAGKNQDRGSLRALKWAEKVSLMMKSHLNKAINDSPEFIENTNVYVCDICGFISVGDEKPDICPICKVPNIKMTQVKRRA